MIGKMLEDVREKRPVIHNITNYVTVNDCANILLACGASPIMADEVEDAKEITAICSGLNINIGTLNERTIKAMRVSGKVSKSLNHPVLLDPVGAGASALRTNTALSIIKEIKPDIIKGNISEIKTLIFGSGTTKGVDADECDAVCEENIDKIIAKASDYSKKCGAVIVITGAIDLVVGKNSAYVIRNGHPIMSAITGAGCMLGAMMSAYAAVNPENLTEACVAAVCAMGVAGERAYKRMGENDGNSTFRNYLIDEIYLMDAKILNEGARYEGR